RRQGRAGAGVPEEAARLARRRDAARRRRGRDGGGAAARQHRSARPATVSDMELTPAPPRSALILWLRRFARLWGFGLFIIVVLIVFRAVVLPFILGLAVAYVLAPVVATLSAAPI